MRPLGGHDVHSITQILADARGPLRIIHVGGEILTCDAWEAAVMLAANDEAARIVRALDRHPEERMTWARKRLHRPDLAPYVLPPSGLHDLPAGTSVHFHAAGGVTLGRRDPAFQHEVLGKLRRANSLTVRDNITVSQLARAGIRASVIPDAVVMVADACATEIAARMPAGSKEGEAADVARRCAKGYIAVQCNAEFGDDATVRALAGQLRALCVAASLPCVLFRAGAAPWHDDLEVLRRIAQAMRPAPALLFESQHVWEACALIAMARLVCASSLHAVIVAMSHAIPCVTIGKPGNDAVDGKHAAFAATWGLPGFPAAAPADALVEAALSALATDPALRRRHAGALMDAHEHAMANFDGEKR
ncbi:polysaccharide pyruvyl transferase family protein [Noviherbaspirillum galbum]|uniref:Polysaccharide pyruvyl transferase family protein n=1 Tax=Noviherbaspirillum galbum TaxID=2709383 RepID=A0A6B3STC0_9BURK|nr:polysaccharide pyruvyl transferase family protein [Noviherbaspirillum galbum]NEX63914.1 polysaccharide pyruvyl transferase family protein [Noviherbaspirillum galbum]